MIRKADLEKGNFEDVQLVVQTHIYIRPAFITHNYTLLAQSTLSKRV